MKIPPEILTSLAGVDDPGRLADTVAAHLSLKIEDKQQILEGGDGRERLEKILGGLEEGPSEIGEIEKKIAKAGMPKEVREKAESELKKLKMMSPMSAEATVVRNYVDWILNVPWKKRSKIRKDLAEAEKIVETDHYGLEKVKERILEYLAVQQRVDKLKGPILCLVGPPGVGKTSLGQSI